MENINQYIVRKYVMASSIQDVIKKEKKTPVRDVWIDEDWKRAQENDPDKMGFKIK